MVLSPVNFPVFVILLFLILLRGRLESWREMRKRERAKSIGQSERCGRMRDGGETYVSAFEKGQPIQNFGVSKMSTTPTSPGE